MLPPVYHRRGPPGERSGARPPSLGVAGGWVKTRRPLAPGTLEGVDDREVRPIDDPDPAAQREQRRRGVVPDRFFRVCGGNYDLPDLPQPVPENVFDTLQRVPEHLDAWLVAAAPLARAGRDKPLDWDEGMRLREVLLFAEALRDYYREMAALARDGIIRPAPTRRLAGARADGEAGDPR